MRSAFIAMMAWALASSAMSQDRPAAPPDPSQQGAVTLARPPGCTTPERRQLDFWLGAWDISRTGQTTAIGESFITSLDQGCVTLEDFHLFTGLEGHGLFGYDATVNKWRQTYIDARGSYGTGQGGLENGAMTFYFIDPPPPPEFSGWQRRVHIQRIDADTVRLWAEHENPTSHNWSPLFDLTYHRRPGPH